jgi:outer membrane lipoprotein carrier protein
MKMLFIFLSAVFSFALTLPKTFSADFNQTIKSDNKTLHYKGKIFYKNGNLVWKYTYPYKKTIWVKDQIYIYEPDLMQVTIMPRKNDTLKELLKKAKKISRNLYMTEYKGKKYYFVYDKYLRKLYYNDDMGNKIEIVFYDFKPNAPSKVFKLNFPNDVDVIHQTN